MFFRKKAIAPALPSQKSPFTITEKAPEPNPLLDEIWRLFWAVGAASAMLSLISYSPQDPSWSTWSTETEFRNWMGRTGSVASDFLFQCFGVAAFALVPLLVSIAMERHRKAPKVTFHKNSFFKKCILYFLFLLSIATLFQGVIPTEWIPWHLPNAGGVVGKLFYWGYSYLAGPIGAMVLSTTGTVALVILLFRVQLTSKVAKSSAIVIQRGKTKAPQLFSRAAEGLRNFRAKIKIPKSKPKMEVPAPETVITTTQEEMPSSLGPEISNDSVQDEELLRISQGHKKIVSNIQRPAMRSRYNGKNFKLPPVADLSGKADTKTKTVDKNWYVEKAEILVQKLRDFGVDGEVVHISPGPVITVYEFKPASGVKIKEIANLSDDLTLALSVLSVRIVAPIPGKPVVGIEIPTPHREIVYFKDLVQETPFFKEDIRIPIALGRLASGEAVTADLAAMPHLLVAGTTGTGKSVFINTLISSLLCRFTPAQLKLILVDPKMVELSNYEGIPHLLLPVVVDSKKAALALRWTVDEMERRYSMMHQLGVRHVDAYNQKVYATKNTEAETLPYIVVIIDEYADLMAVVPKDVEMSIARLAQKARAAGIHLVLATQRPSTDVVTGTIKANFPSRISFRVASGVDSKTILDRAGAERLLGNGDMLFHSAGFTSLKRMQGAYVSDADIENIVSHLKSQGGSEYDERVLRQLESEDLADVDEDSLDSAADEGSLYDAAVRLVTEKGEASISLIQRHLRIGYNRAATLMEQMEKEGVVAQSTGGAKRRAVLVNQI